MTIEAEQSNRSHSNLVVAGFVIGVIGIVGITVLGVLIPHPSDSQWNHRHDGAADEEAGHG